MRGETKRAEVVVILSAPDKHDDIERRQPEENEPKWMRSGGKGSQFGSQRLKHFRSIVGIRISFKKDSRTKPQL
jgi:hypothetical protein